MPSNPNPNPKPNPDPYPNPNSNPHQARAFDATAVGADGAANAASLAADAAAAGFGALPLLGRVGALLDATPKPRPARNSLFSEGELAEAAELVWGHVPTVWAGFSGSVRSALPPSRAPNTNPNPNPNPDH